MAVIAHGMQCAVFIFFTQLDTVINVVNPRIGFCKFFSLIDNINDIITMDIAIHIRIEVIDHFFAGKGFLHTKKSIRHQNCPDTAFDKLINRKRNLGFFEFLSSSLRKFIILFRRHTTTPNFHHWKKEHPSNNSPSNYILN